MTNKATIKMLEKVEDVWEFFKTTRCNRKIGLLIIKNIYQEYLRG